MIFFKVQIQVIPWILTLFCYQLAECPWVSHRTFLGTISFLSKGMCSDSFMEEAAPWGVDRLGDFAGPPWPLLCAVVCLQGGLLWHQYRL